MLMVPYRQTQLPQLPCLIYAKSAQWIKSPPQESGTAITVPFHSIRQGL